VRPFSSTLPPFSTHRLLQPSFRFRIVTPPKSLGTPLWVFRNPCVQDPFSNPLYIHFSVFANPFFRAMSMYILGPPHLSDQWRRELYQKKRRLIETSIYLTLSLDQKYVAQIQKCMKDPSSYKTIDYCLESLIMGEPNRNKPHRFGSPS